jgi:large subunit ribosomal protein L23
MTLEARRVLKRPVLTERSTELKRDRGQVVFEVYREATKPQIKAAIETAFKVRVVSVNTLIVHGKMKRFRTTATKRPNWKKAIVTLREGDKIEAFEGV